MPVFKHTSNTLLAFRHLSVCVCVWSHAILHSSRVAPGLAQSGFTQERCFTLGCVCLHMCMCVCVHYNKDSPVCSVVLRHFMVKPDHPHLHAYSYHSNPDNSSHGSIEESTVGSCMCVDWSSGPRCPDSLPSTFSQPRHLCCSAVTLATMAAACEPARLPRTQRRLRQPLTSEAATKRPETSRVGSSVNRPESQIYSARLK